MTGITSYHAGLAAEDIVGRHYAGLGWSVRETRWRGAGGEIDIVCEHGGTLLFVEVKKSRSHDIAAQRVSRRQLIRIHNSAEEYMGRLAFGLNTDARIDEALVDSVGQVAVLENVTLH